MGKGDRRSRRGKIFAGSFGKTRPHTKKNTKKVPVKVAPQPKAKAATAKKSAK